MIDDLGMQGRPQVKPKHAQVWGCLERGEGDGAIPEPALATNDGQSKGHPLTIKVTVSRLV